MRQLFCSINLLLVTICAFSQTKTLFEKSINVENISELELKTSNVSINLLESLDNNIYITFTVEYRNFPESLINERVKSLKVKDEIKQEKVVIDIESDYYFSDFQVESNSEGNTTEFVDKMMSFFSEKKKSNKVLEIEDVLSRFKSVKIIKTNFEIKIPNYLQCVITSVASNIKSNLSYEKLNLILKEGEFSGKEIDNSDISITEGAKITFEKVSKSKIISKNVSTFKIKDIDNSTLDTETSTIEIEKIGKNVTIDDFNSEFSLFSFSKDFKTFDFKGEYSTINFYEPKNGFILQAYGHSTVFKHGDFEQKSEGKNKNKRMFIMKGNLTKGFTGNINLNLVNSKFNYKRESFIEKE